MKILLVNGSGGSNSTNKKLLLAFSELFQNSDFIYMKGLHRLPLFHIDIKDINNKEVDQWLQMIADADALIISTPEYLHNMPALLKNALEWTTESGVLENKKVIAMIYTPYEPRGEKAMQSLIYSLSALKAKIILQLPIYHTDISFDSEGDVIDNGGVEMLREAMKLLGN